MNLGQLAIEADDLAHKEVYGLPPQRDVLQLRKAIHFASHVAHRAIEECMREVQAADVRAPDTQIVKDKINAKLRQLAADVRI